MNFKNTRYCRNLVHAKPRFKNVQQSCAILSGALIKRNRHVESWIQVVALCIVPLAMSFKFFPIIFIFIKRYYKTESTQS